MPTQNIYDLVDTWNAGATTFTAVKMNVTDTASASGSLLMDLQVGGSSKFKVSKAGDATAENVTARRFKNTDNTVNLNGQDGFLSGNSSFQVSWTSSSSSEGTRDTILTRRAAANLRLGAADAAAPVAQTLSVQSVVAGTTNTAGANLTITGSQGTGTGAGGSIVFQVAPAGSSGTAQNALATALTIGADRTVSFGGSSAAIVRGSNGYLEFANTGNSAFLFFGNGYGAGNDAFTLDPNSGRIQVRANGGIAWSNQSAYANSTPDLILARDAANTLALRNGANAQTFNVYKTYTDASNYERVTYGYSAVSGGYGISAEKAGTGGNNDIYINTQNRLFLDVSQNRAWAISSTRTLYPANTQSTTMTDNFLNIPGASGAPTGTPAVTTGFPIYYDSSAHKIYVYAGGTWRSTAALT